MDKWLLKNKKAEYKEICKKHGISEFIAKLITNRGIKGDGNIERYINPSFVWSHDPFLMKDVSLAIEIILKAKENDQKIRVVGDYDVDGVISTFLLYKSLSEIGCDVDYLIPDRIKDGYGINKDLINRSIEDNVDVIITCDNGIAALEQIQYAKDNGLVVIVTDHHDIPYIEEDGEKIYQLVNADAVVNPKQKDCEYPFDKICGAGVVFKIIQGLFSVLNKSEFECLKYIEYAAIATVCDVVDLEDENRIIVNEGLKALSRTSNIGLNALIKENKLDVGSISTYHLGFVIGPCINASGRLEHASKGVDLLFTDDKEEANTLAKELVELNTLRKSMTKDGVDEAIQLIEDNELYKSNVLVVYLPEIHESLAGIIAGRLKEKYYLPTIVLTKVEEGVKGSARSIESYNMFEKLTECKSLLNKFGGHPMAAGLSLDEDKIDSLRDYLNENDNLTEEDLTRVTYLDMQLPLRYISEDLIDEIGRLEPYGKGNAKPVFGEKNVSIAKLKVLGQNKNVLKVDMLSENRGYNGIYFGDIDHFNQKITDKHGTEVCEGLYTSDLSDVPMDIAFFPSINEFRGNRSVQIIIEDIK